MNTVTKKAERLLESDVHAAIEAIIEANEKPSALNLLKALGRGSLTTISKYLASYNSANDEGKTEANPPALIDLPRELGLSGELLIRKIWTDARALANQEIESQRVALTQAEAEASAKITEAMEFSEIQAKRIEELENMIDELNKETEKKDTQHKELLNKNDQLEKALNIQTKEKEIALNNINFIRENMARVDKDCDNLRNKIVEEDKLSKKKLENKNKILEELEKNNKSLELQVGKHKIALDSQANSLESIKNELAGCKKDCKKAENLAAVLTGKLEVYQAKQIEELEKQKSTI